MNYFQPISLLGFAAAFLITCELTTFVKRWALNHHVVDSPDQPRKIQAHPIPLLGGWAVYGGFGVTLLGLSLWHGGPLGEHIKTAPIWGLLIGGAILMIGGYLDDRYHLPPSRSIIAPVLAVLAILISGVQLSYINHPLGGVLPLDSLKLYGYPVWSAVFVFVWVLGMIYTTKFLDGMDGLVVGTVGIGAIVLYFLSQIPVVDQPDTALLSLILAGSLLGFLPWNFHPARIFLGESGSTFAGFVLGVLAVISGGKIATALLIMGLPILDVAWVIVRRATNQFSPFQADRKHLHFRLLDLGLSQRQTVLFLYFLSAGFGVSGLYLQSVGKLIALSILFLVMVVLGTALVVAYQHKQKGSAE